MPKSNKSLTIANYEKIQKYHLQLWHEINLIITGKNGVPDVSDLVHQIKCLVEFKKKHEGDENAKSRSIV